MLLVARQHRHRREPESDRVQRRIEADQAERDVADDALVIHRNQRYHCFSRGAQLVDQVRFGRGRERGFVDAAYGRRVAGQLGADLDHEGMAR
ncbi:hypothetical protein D3C83_67880 [compost metagenome]